MSNSIVNFLEGIGTDSRNRHIDEILDEDNRYWEHTHDFIQWLFPLNEESRAVNNSPVLTVEEVERIRTSERAKEGLKSRGRALSIIFVKNITMEKSLQPQSSPHHQSDKVLATADG